MLQLSRSLPRALVALCEQSSNLCFLELFWLLNLLARTP